MSTLRAVGIDPGGTTGLVCIDVPLPLHLPAAKWVGHATVSTSSSKKLTYAEQKVDMGDRFHVKASAWEIDRPIQVIVSELPLDFGESYAGAQGQSGRRQKRGTAAVLGLHTGIILAAAAMYPPTGHLHGYPVTDFNGLPGWMQRTPRNIVLNNMALLARSMGCTDDLPEHCLMALGVLYFHLSRFGYTA